MGRLLVSCKALLGACPPAPGRGIPTGVKAPKYERTFGLEDVEHAVWKPVEKRSSDLPVDDWIDLGVSLDVPQDVFEGSNEVVGEVGASLCIPRACGLEVREGLRCEPDGHSSGSSRDRASDQGTAASGFSACALRRRSSS